MYAAHEHDPVESRHHAGGIPSLSPDDRQGINQPDWQHSLLQHILKSNYLAPIAGPAHILDVGCGTGRWPGEMALEFPQADLVGIDLTLPDQEASTFPPNCHFRTGNVLERLPFEDNSFDFVHQRFMLFAIPQPDWPRLVSELARVTRRGGWIELVEANPFLRRMGPATERVVGLIGQAARQREIDPTIAERLGSLLSATGLKHIGASTQLIPVGSWSGQSGMMAVEDMRVSVRAMKPLVMLHARIVSDEFDRLLLQIEREVEQYHTTFTFHIAYGQRQ